MADSAEGRRPVQENCAEDGSGSWAAAGSGECAEDGSGSRAAVAASRGCDGCAGGRGVAAPFVVAAEGGARRVSAPSPEASRAGGPARRDRAQVRARRRLGRAGARWTTTPTGECRTCGRTGGPRRGSTRSHGRGRPGCRTGGCARLAAVDGGDGEAQARRRRPGSTGSVAPLSEAANAVIASLRGAVPVAEQQGLAALVVEVEIVMAVLGPEGLEPGGSRGRSAGEVVARFGDLPAGARADVLARLDRGEPHDLGDRCFTSASPASHRLRAISRPLRAVRTK